MEFISRIHHQTQVIKVNIDFMRLRRFYASKSTNERKHLYVESIFRIQTQLLKLNSNRISNNVIKKQAKDSNRHFAVADTQTADRHVKGCLAPASIREM